MTYFQKPHRTGDAHPIAPRMNSICCRIAHWSFEALFDMRWVLLSLLVALPARLHAQFTYTTNNGAITITGYDCLGGGVLTVPGTINGLPVMRIGDRAFSECTGLSSVTLPDSVTSIGEAAFQDCTSLTSATNLGRVNMIGAGAFSGCASLAAITIPESVTNIGPAAFAGCSSLKAIRCSATNSTYSTVEGVLFKDSESTLIACPAGKTGTYRIPNTVNTIEFKAFFGCSKLTGVVMPCSINSIRDLAFSFCTNLSGIYFEGSPPHANSSVFSHADNLIVYHLPEFPDWDSSYSERPAVLWELKAVVTNGGSGGAANELTVTVDWVIDRTVVVEACTNLVGAIWTPIGTNRLTGGSFYFSDPEQAKHPTRLYRVFATQRLRGE
jgi:hypothetical protein